MNNLSWFIYLADVANGIIVLLVGGVLVSILATIVFAVGWVDASSGEEENRYKLLMKKLLFVAVPVFALFAAIIPSGRTIMFIAASEFGEDLYHTGTASKAQKALDKFLSNYLEEE